MTDIRKFLTVLKKYGYPNPKIQFLAKMSDYNLDNFLIDLEKLFGNKGLVKFCNKAIDKISTDEGIKVVWPESDEYVFVEISNLRYDPEESEDTVYVTTSFGRSRIFYTDENGVEGYKTIEEISDEVDMGDFSDYQDMIDGIRNQVENIILENCGFHIWIE